MHAVGLTKSCVNLTVDPKKYNLKLYMYRTGWVLEPMNGLDFLKVTPTHVYISICTAHCTVALPAIVFPEAAGTYQHF